MTPLLSTRLSARYGSRVALDEVELSLAAGEILGVVGQSGSGKSTLALALMNLLDWQGGSVSGSVLFRDRDLLAMSRRELRELRGADISLVLQSASAALNPALRLDSHFREAWRAHSAVPWREKRAEVRQSLALFALPADDEFLSRYPRQISTGQAQRVLIAMALLHRPALLIADEPTSALDALTTRDVLECLKTANRDWGASILYITHDLATVPGLCHRVAILQAGKVVEIGDCSRVFSTPSHPYTRALLEALPSSPTPITVSR